MHLESSQDSSSKDIKEIYTVPAHEREKNLQCLSDMLLTKVIHEGDGLYKHIFKKRDSNNTTDLLHSAINKSNYVVVSTDKRPGVASGYVANKDSATITVSLDRYKSNSYANSN